MIEHMDNFSSYGTLDALLTNGVYADNVGYLRANPDGSGDIVYLNKDIAQSDSIRYVFNAAATTCGIACRIWLTKLPTVAGGQPTISIRDVNNVILYTISFNTTGRAEIWSGYLQPGTLLATSTLPAITANGWYHIEFKSVISATVGSLEIRVEGVPVLGLTGQNTGTSSIYQMSIGGGYSALLPPDFYTKDLYIWNGAGTYNKDWAGTVLIYSLKPDADVSLNWSLTGGATGAAILANSPPLTSQYVYAGTPPPAAYKCSVSDLPLNVTSVRGLMTMVRAAKVDGGDASLQIGIISDPLGTPVTGLGANRPITVSQTYWRDVFEVDPKTSVPFVPSAVNALNLQMNRTL